jgi:hypothetical protein
MRRYLASRFVQVGLALVIGGSLPLVLIMTAAALGLTDDPNPNPIGAGFLVMLTFWPGVICLLVGIGRVAVQRRSKQG